MTEKSILYIHALTSLHPGSGTALGVVDLPVQRERHTQWPLIPGSSLKGVLRAACREKLSEGNGDRQKANSSPDLTAIFGPESGKASDHAGALALTDARLLAFPVRSLKGVFAWTTCPSLLTRFKRDLEMAGISTGGLAQIPEPPPEHIICGDVLKIDGGKVLLEEFEFTVTPGDVSPIATALKHAIADDGTKEQMKARLAILNDNDFTHFARHATEVTARIGLDAETKTVKEGALFYQEFLPPETLFYSVVLAEKSRGSKAMTAADVMKSVMRDDLKYLQIGGDETIGKGLCAISWQPGEVK